jgi:hypothetical protein
LWCRLQTSQGFYPFFPDRDFPGCGLVLVLEAWLASPELSELPSRSVAEDAELLLVVRERSVARAEAAVLALLLVVRGLQVARVEAEVSALPGRLEAQLAPEQAAVSDARVGPVRAFAEPKAAQLAQSRAVDPGPLAVVFAPRSSVEVAAAEPGALASALLVAAQAESAQAVAVPEFVARVESRAVAPDPSEALGAQELCAPAAVFVSGLGVPAHSAWTVQAE